jgi:anti-sigma factor RsiW
VSLPDDPACNEIVELVTAFLDGAMTADDRVRFEQHLVVCEACAVYVDQVRQTIRLTGRFGAPELSAQARDSFVTLLRGWKAGGASRT